MDWKFFLLGVVLLAGAYLVYKIPLKGSVRDTEFGVVQNIRSSRSFLWWRLVFAFIIAGIMAIVRSLVR